MVWISSVQKTGGFPIVELTWSVKVQICELFEEFLPQGLDNFQICASTTPPIQAYAQVSSNSIHPIFDSSELKIWVIILPMMFDFANFADLGSF